MDQDHLCRALLQYSLSPARKLYGHPVQDTLPAHRRSFAPEWQQKFQEADMHREHNLREAENYYNSHAHELPDIHVGSSVAIQHPQTKLWETYGTVIAISPHRKYYVTTQSGRAFVCNLCFIKNVHPYPSLWTSTNQYHLLNHPHQRNTLTSHRKLQ